MSDDAGAREHLDLDWSGLEVIGMEECRRLLSSVPVGRLGFLQEGSPVVLPINFHVDRRSIVFRTGRGSKLEAATMGRAVCVEVDAWNAVEHTGWSVLAKGTAEHVTDGAELDRLVRLPVKPWCRPDVRHEWIRVRVDELTGRRIHQQ